MQICTMLWHTHENYNLYGGQKQAGENNGRDKQGSRSGYYHPAERGAGGSDVAGGLQRDRGDLISVEKPGQRRPAL